MSFDFKIAKHYLDIKKYGFKEFIRKLKVLNLKIINFFLILILVCPLMPIVLIFSPIIIFRFGLIRSGRIGHLLANTEIYLCEKKINNKQVKFIYDFICYDLNISNTFLAKHYKKKIDIYPNILIKPFCDFLKFFNNKKFLKKFEISILGAGGDRDINGLLYKTHSSSLKFDMGDVNKIDNQLNKLGLDLKSKFICLDVRDDAYLKKVYPKTDWNYHNYRDWDINKFLKTAESLTQRGYHVIRMGQIVKEKINSKNPMIIDYANSQFKSDILDIYLHTKCFFTATTGTGVDLASYVSRRPMAWISVPVCGFYTFKNHFHSTKHHKYKDSGKKLSLTEIFKTGFANDPNNNQYKNDIILEQLDANEIEDYFVEVLDILEKKKVLSKEDLYLQTQFWSKYQNLINKYNLNHLHKNYESIFSPIFLKNNLELLN